MEDAKIIDLFFLRSETAVTELDQKYGIACKQLAFHILNNREDAEECVNDAYLAVWNTIPPNRPALLRAYLCRIVRNLSIKKYRANTAEKRNSFYDRSLEELAECIPAHETVENQWDAKELGKQLVAFLGTLDQKNRILFLRRYWFSEPLAELAADFHITEHNAAVRLSRIRAKLRNYLSKEGFRR